MPPTEKGMQLFEHLIWRLTLNFLTGVLPRLMLLSDETGRNLAAAQKFIYVDKGVREVLAQLYDDKRAITVNPVYTMTGELAFVQIVYTGTPGSSKSLPTAEAMARIPEWLKGKVCLFNFESQVRSDVCIHHFLFQIFVYNSKNHWSNQEIKNDQIRLSEEFRQRVIKELIESKQMSEHQARSLRMCLVLDCWPVNLSAETKCLVVERYLYISIHFVPAGLTCVGQVGDTDLQVPFHAGYDKGFKEWCVREVSIETTCKDMYLCHIQALYVVSAKHC